MTDLIARLQQAETGSRTLDLGIHQAAGKCAHRNVSHYYVQSDTVITYDDGKQVPFYTTSLDACKALQEEVLPDSYWTIDGGPPVTVDVFVFTKNPNGLFRAEHNDECLAWTIAILKAVQARDAETGNTK